MTHISEADFVLSLFNEWPADASVSDDLLSRSLEAITRFPRSRRLCVMRADLLQLHNARSFASVPEAKALYERAIDIDPNFAEAWEELAAYVEIREDDLVTAKTLYEQAIRIAGSPTAYVGLARVLSELGGVSEARTLLSPDTCPHHDHPAVFEFLRNEGLERTT